MVKLVNFDLEKYKESAHYRKVLNSEDLAMGDSGWLNRCLIKFQAKTTSQLHDNKKWAEKVRVWVATERQWSTPDPTAKDRKFKQGSVVKNSSFKTNEEMVEMFEEADNTAPSPDVAKEYFRKMREAVGIKPESKEEQVATKSQK